MRTGGMEKRELKGLRNGIGLDHAAHTKGGRRAEPGVKKPGPPAAKAPFHIEHGAGHPASAPVPLPVTDPQHRFTIGRGHAQKGRYPHPEYGPGPPDKRAVATPAMFPVPMVAARAVHADWNGDIPRPHPLPCMFSSLVPVFSGVFHRLPAVFFHHRGNPRTQNLLTGSYKGSPQPGIKPASPAPRPSYGSNGSFQPPAATFLIMFYSNLP